MSDVLMCNEWHKCKEYDKDGIKKCEKCEYSTSKKSMFKPKTTSK